MDNPMTDKNAPTGKLQYDLYGFIEQEYEVKDKYQHTLVWRPVPRPMFNGIVLYPKSD
jgi:hypothetical protein